MLWLPLGITILVLLLQGIAVITDGGTSRSEPAKFSYTMNETLVDDNSTIGSEPQINSKTVTKNFTASSLLLSIFGHQQTETSSPLEPMLIGFSFPIMALLALATLIYTHSCLYGDRARKEILFWRSLPVSETQNLVCKLLVILIILPTIYCLTIMIYGAGAILLNGLSSWENWLFLILKLSELTLIVILFSVFALPLISWILVCSAAARRAPIFLSLLIPLGLGMLLRFSLGKNYITSSLGDYIKAISSQVKISPEMLQQQLKFLISSEFLLALALSLGLLLVSLWLRKHRYEI